MPVAKKQIRQIISKSSINSVADVYTLLRDSFKDILQELMEDEMDATLVDKKQKGISSPTIRKTDIPRFVSPLSQNSLQKLLYKDTDQQSIK